MARFQGGGASTDEQSSTPLAGRTKQPLHPTLSTGPTIQTKKPVLESLSGSAINIPPKPNFLKNTVSAKSETDVQEPNKSKALASRFSNTQDDTKTNGKHFINKQQIPPKPHLSQVPEAKGPGQKPPPNKPCLGSTLSDGMPAVPKPPPAAVPKPSWVKQDAGGGETGSTPPMPTLLQKPSSSVLKLRQQNEEMGAANHNVTNKPPFVPNSTFNKSPSNFKMAQNMFNKDMDRTEQSECGVRAEGASTRPLAAMTSITPSKPPASKKPSIKRPFPPASSVNGNATSGPKQNPLPNSLALGHPPAKPNRPPKVNLEQFKRGSELVGPLETIQQGKACVDCRGSKTDLALKQGDCLDIIRVQGNPEGKWLGRTQDGSSEFTHFTGLILASAIDEQIYDDVDSQALVQPPPISRYSDIEQSDTESTFIFCCLFGFVLIIVGLYFVFYLIVLRSSIPHLKGKSKTEEMYPKKQKKMEKEEKEFRRKFKYEGELKVLYQVTVISTLTSKKWASKDLPVKAGEELDVIMKAGNDKLICRNEEGKCKYLDGDIYDDIGDGMFIFNNFMSYCRF
uniref:Helically-extended SH3 domain-containing protein n=1 Tax=Mola mola TaxID=94237 RepID=A0A3Q3XLW6_MOLML